VAVGLQPKSYFFSAIHVELAQRFLATPEPVLGRIVPGEIPAGSTPGRAPSQGKAPPDYEQHEGHRRKNKRKDTHGMVF